MATGKLFIELTAKEVVVTAIMQGRPRTVARYTQPNAAKLAIRRAATIMGNVVARAHRKALGICAECGKERALPGRVAGQKCRAMNGQAVARLHARRRKANLCIYCGLEPLLPGRSRGKRCQAQRKRTDKKRYDRRKRQGLCPSCGNPPQQGMVRCAKCIGASEGWRKQTTHDKCTRCKLISAHNDPVDPWCRLCQLGWPIERIRKLKEREDAYYRRVLKPKRKAEAKRNGLPIAGTGD